MEIIITDPNGLERRQFRLVLLNEIMLQTALARRFKNPLPVDDPLAYGCKSLARRWTGGRRRIMFPFILNVQKRKPPGVFVHVSDGVVSGPRDPEAIHFKIHKGGIGMLNQVIERNHVPEFFQSPGCDCDRRDGCRTFCTARRSCSGIRPRAYKRQPSGAESLGAKAVPHTPCPTRANPREASASLNRIARSRNGRSGL